MRYYVSWKTTGYYRKDSLKLAARCPSADAGLLVLLGLIGAFQIGFVFVFVMVALCNRADHIYFHPVVCYGRPM